MLPGLADSCTWCNGASLHVHYLPNAPVFLQDSNLLALFLSLSLSVSLSLSLSLSLLVVSFLLCLGVVSVYMCAYYFASVPHSFLLVAARLSLSLALG